jgi:acetoin utilization protein AcuB
VDNHRVDTIDSFMTRDPSCIDSAQPIAEAFNRMFRIGCRHLPVISAGKLVGIISLNGLRRLESRDVLARLTRLAYDAAEEPFVVVPGTPVAEVATRMAAGRFEAALVVDRGAVVGIFTGTDALRAIASLIANQTKPATAAA